MRKVGLLLLVGWLSAGLGGAEEATPGLAVEGRVVDRADSGLAGVAVELWSIQPREAKPALNPVARTATDPEGRFSLFAPSPGMWRLVVEAQGIGRRERPLLPLFDDASLLPVELSGELPNRFPRDGEGGWQPTAPPSSPGLRGGPPVRLTGRVIDATTQRPVSGAWVWSADDPGGVVRTDRAGVYQLARPGAEPFEVHAADPRYAPVAAKVERGVVPLLALMPSPALFGRVVDDGGRPVPGAEILLSRRTEGGSWSAREDAKRARTRADGTFRISGLTAAASYDLLAASVGFAPTRWAVTVPSGREISSAEALLPRIVLSRGLAVFGAVIDSSGRPVAGARVELFRSALGRRAPGAASSRIESGLYRAVSGWKGRFALQSLPAGRYDLRIEARGLAQLAQDGIELVDRPKPHDLGRFVLERGNALVGIVEDPDGKPIADAEVWVVPGAPVEDWQAYYRKGPAARTGPKGEYALSDLPPETELSLDICRPGFLPETVAIRDPAMEPKRTIVLARAGEISGRVLDPAGRPVADAALVGWLSGEGPASASSVRPCRLGGTSATSDAEGRFRLGPLVSGWWSVKASANGWLDAESGRHQVPEGATLSKFDLVLGVGAVLSGRVLSPQGGPVAGAEVQAYGDRSSPKATSAGDGTYRLAGVEPGARTVEATHPDYDWVSRRLKIEPGENRVDLRLGPDARREIRGRVVDPGGAPVAGCRVLIPASSAVYTAADGSFVLREKDGTYEIWADKEGYAPSRTVEPVTVSGAAVSGLKIHLAVGGILTGRLLGLAPKDRVGARVRVEVPPFSAAAAVAADGSYRVVELPSGEAQVFAQAGGRTVQGRVVLAPGASEAELDLTFAPTVEVSGRVTGPNGEPVADASVRLFALGGGGGGSVFTRPDGSFRLPLEDGTYRGWGYKKGFRRTGLESPLEIAGAPVGAIEIRLEPEVVLRGRIFGLEAGERVHEVWADGPSGALRTGEVDQQAGYSVTGLTPGEWQVRARYGDRQAGAAVTVDPDRLDLSVDLNFAQAEPAPP